MLEAALFPRKFSFHLFLFFPFYVGPDPNPELEYILFQFTVA